MLSKTCTPKNSKILVETSVLLAASIRVSFPEGEIKDEFYDPSIALFAFIRKNLSHRVGIITQTVEQEALRTLSSAVIGTLEKNVPDKAKDFEYKSTAWNICEGNMRKLTNILLREPCDEEELRDINDEVYHMYKGLEARAIEADGDIRRVAHKKIEGMATSAKMENAIFDFQIQLVKQENAQLLRLKRHHASPTDIRILAEAIQIKHRHEAAGATLYYFVASTDTNNFSPAKSEWGLSKTVTDEISSRYGIVCDHPAQIQARF